MSDGTDHHVSFCLAYERNFKVSERNKRNEASEGGREEEKQALQMKMQPSRHPDSSLRDSGREPSQVPVVLKLMDLDELDIPGSSQKQAPLSQFVDHIVHGSQSQVSDICELSRYLRG